MDLDNTTTLLIYSFLPLSSKLKFNTPDMGEIFFKKILSLMQNLLSQYICTP